MIKVNFANNLVTPEELLQRKYNNSNLSKILEAFNKNNASGTDTTPANPRVSLGAVQNRLEHTVSDTELNFTVNENINLEITAEDFFIIPNNNQQVLDLLGGFTLDDIMTDVPTGSVANLQDYFSQDTLDNNSAQNVVASTSETGGTQTPAN